MYVLNQVTFSYSPEEDRISLLSECCSGEKIRLWLTNRLARQLIPHLLELVSVYGVTQDSKEAGAISRDHSGERTQNSEPELTLQQDIPEFLISMIDLTARDANFILTFRGEKSEERAALGISYAASHQIAEALQACSEKAGWSHTLQKPQLDRSKQYSAKKVTIH